VLPTAAAIANARLPVLLEVEDFLYDGAFIMALCEAACRFQFDAATATVASWPQNVLVFVQPVSTVDKGTQSKRLLSAAVELLPKRCAPPRVTVRDNDLKKPAAADLLLPVQRGDRKAPPSPLHVLQSVYSIENAVLTLRVVKQVFERERADIAAFIKHLVSDVWSRPGFDAILDSFGSLGDENAGLAALSFFNACCGHPAGIARMYAAQPQLEVSSLLEHVDDAAEFFDQVKQVVTDPATFGELRVRLGLDNQNAWCELLGPVPSVANVLNGDGKQLGQLSVVAGELVLKRSQDKQSKTSSKMPQLMGCTLELLDKGKTPGLKLNETTKLYFATAELRNTWYEFLVSASDLPARIVAKVRSFVEDCGYFAKCGAIPDLVRVRGKHLIVSPDSHALNLGALLTSKPEDRDIQQAVLFVVLRWCRGHTCMSLMMMRRGASRMRASDIASTPLARDAFGLLASRDDSSLEQTGLVEKRKRFLTLYQDTDKREKRDIALEAINVFYSNVLHEGSVKSLAPEDRFWDELCRALGDPEWLTRPCEHECPIRFAPWEHGRELHCSECDCSDALTSTVINGLASDPEYLAALVSPAFVADMLMAHANAKVATKEQAWAAHIELGHLQRSYARVFAEQNAELRTVTAKPHQSALDRAFVRFVTDLRVEGSAIKASLDDGDAHARRNPLNVPRCAAMGGLCDRGADTDPALDDWNAGDLGPRTGSDLADDGAARP
jgi:hypothetical protein